MRPQPCGFVLAFLALTCVVAASVTRGAEMELVDVVAKVEGSVVRVDTDKALGSGVIVGNEGLVVTNFHVVDDATEAKITLRSGKVMQALGYLSVNPGHDLVLLKIEKLEAPLAIELADKLPRVGEKVAAFGNPQGLSFTTSEGIVSAVRTGDELIDIIGQDAYSSLGYAADATWIQTTAPISQGNSGGPLVMMDATLVGINTWCHTQGQNLNFAIGLTDIKRLLADTLKGAIPKRLTSLPRVRGRTVRPSIGRPEEFKLELPTGRVFSFAIFELGLGQALELANPDEDTVVIQHPNGALYAAANQHMGQLHGVTIAQYDNREPMVYATYREGKRHGVMKTWNEAGKAVLFAQYAFGRRHGFTCLFDDGDLALVAQYGNDELEYVQLMSGRHALEGFPNRQEAEKHPKAQKRLAKLDELDATLKKNEVAFRKQVRESELAKRRALAAQLGPEKRRRIQDRINQQAAKNAAFFRELERAATGR
jgi:S1-C subfamily serine protease